MNASSPAAFTLASCLAARLRARSETGMAQSWYFLPPASISVEYEDRTPSTPAHGTVIVRNGLRTRIRSEFAKTAGRSVSATMSGSASSSAAMASQGV